MRERRMGLFAVFAWAMLLGAACTGTTTGSAALSDSDNAILDSFRLEVLTDTYQGGASGQFSISTVDIADDYLDIEIHVDNTRNLKAVQFFLRFDDESYSPESVAGADDLGVPGFAAECLRLDYLGLPGEVHHGLISVSTDSGLSGSSCLAVVRFVKQPQVLSRRISTAPQSTRSRAPLIPDYDNDRFKWWHANEGDYNQDGLVDMADLTPLGVHFNKTGPFADDSVESVVDGNADGWITVGDITSIGVCYGNSMTGGFNVYAGTADQYPPDGIEDSSSSPIANVGLSTALGDKRFDRLAYAYSPEGEDLANLHWVRGVNGDGEEGIASQVGRLWQRTIVSAAGQVITYSDMAVDSIGNIHICYLNETANSLDYAFSDGETWEISTVDDQGSPGHYPSIAVTPSDSPIICYVTFDDKELRFARLDADVWGLETIPGVEAYLDTSLEIDSSGYAHACFYNWGEDSLQYISDKTGSWVIETFDSDNVVGVTNSLALDSSFKPHVVYRTSDDTLRYASRESGSWQNEVVDQAGEPGIFNAIDVGSDGRAHICYYDNLDSSLRYATNEDGMWMIQNLTQPGSGTGLYCAITLDAADRPHVCYVDELNGTIMYGLLLSGWQFMSLSAGTLAGRCLNLEFAPDGKPYLALIDQISTHIAVYE